MKCGEFKNYLEKNAALKKPLPEAMLGHAKECAACNDLLTEKNDAIRELDGYSMPEISANEWLRIENQVMAQIPQLQKKPVPASTLTSLFPSRFLKPAFGLVLLVLLVFGLLFVTQQRNTGASSLAFDLRKLQGNVSVGFEDNQPWKLLNASDTSVRNKIASAEKPFRLKTATASEAGFSFDKQASFLLEENSSIQVVAATSHSLHLLLSQGSVTAFVKPNSGLKEVRVETENAFCIITGTLFRVSVDTLAGLGLRTTLRVDKGSVRFVSKNDAAKETLVTHGNEMTMTGSGFAESPPPTADTMQSVHRLERLLTRESAETLASLHLVTTPPACSVWCNERLLGLTPLYVLQPAGLCTLGLRHHGYLSRTETVNLTAGKPYRFYADLDPVQAMLPETVAPVRPAPREMRLNEPPVAQATAAPKTDTLAKAGAEARRLYRAGKFKEALPLLLLCSGTDPQCRAWLGRCYLALGRISEAENVLGALADDRSVSADIRDNALFDLVELAMEQRRDFKVAGARLDRYLAEFPEGRWIEEALFSRAQVMQSQNRFAEAATALERYAAKFPEGPRITKTLYQLGVVYLHHLNEPARALTSFEKLLKLAPADATAGDAMFWRAQTLYGLGKPADALTGFNDYLKKYPDGQWAATSHEMVRNLVSGK